MVKPPLTVILIALNVSEQIGGEAMKALQIFRYLRNAGVDVIQITHERCYADLTTRLGERDV